MPMRNDYIPTHVHKELGDVRYICDENHRHQDFYTYAELANKCQVIVLGGEYKGAITTVDKQDLVRAGNIDQLPEPSYKAMQREYSPYAGEKLSEIRGDGTLHDFSRHDAWLLCRRYEDHPGFIVDQPTAPQEKGAPPVAPDESSPDPTFPVDLQIEGPDEEGDWSASVPEWDIDAFGSTPSEALRELSVAVSLYEPDWSNVPA
jgi:predicted RNase H-like HicB family nuclease